MGQQLIKITRCPLAVLMSFNALPNFDKEGRYIGTVANRSQMGNENNLRAIRQRMSTVVTQNVRKWRLHHAVMERGREKSSYEAKDATHAPCLRSLCVRYSALQQTMSRMDALYVKVIDRCVALKNEQLKSSSAQASASEPENCESFETHQLSLKNVVMMSIGDFSGTCVNFIAARFVYVDLHDELFNVLYNPYPSKINRVLASANRESPSLLTHLDMRLSIVYSMLEQVHRKRLIDLCFVISGNVCEHTTYMNAYTHYIKGKCIRTRTRTHTHMHACMTNEN